jgi:hypothetical protein
MKLWICNSLLSDHVPLLFGSCYLVIMIACFVLPEPPKNAVLANGIRRGFMVSMHGLEDSLVISEPPSQLFGLQVKDIPENGCEDRLPENNHEFTDSYPTLAM